MPLKKQKGNMYEFVTHMWGPIRGNVNMIVPIVI
jgi:hypothetical protein